MKTRRQLSSQERIELTKGSALFPLKLWSQQKRRWISAKSLPSVSLEDIYLEEGNELEFYLKNNRYRALDKLDRNAWVQYLRDIVCMKRNYSSIKLETSSVNLSPEFKSLQEEHPSFLSESDKDGCTEVCFLEEDFTIRILGVSHIDKSSKSSAVHEIESKRPMTVIVELDPLRLLKLEKRRQEHSWLGPVIYSVLSCFRAFMYSIVWEDPSEIVVDLNLAFENHGFGFELLESVESAQRIGAHIIFGDLDFQRDANLLFFPEERDDESSFEDDNVEEEDFEFSNNNAMFELTIDSEDKDLLAENKITLPHYTPLIDMHNLELRNRNLELAYTSVYQATGKLRLLVTGADHVEGIVEEMKKIVYEKDMSLMRICMTLRNFENKPDNEVLWCLKMLLTCIFDDQCEFALRFILKSTILKDLIRLLELRNNEPGQLELAFEIFCILLDKVMSTTIEKYFNFNHLLDAVSNVMILHASAYSKLFVDGCYLIRKLNPIKLRSISTILFGLNFYDTVNSVESLKAQHACILSIFHFTQDVEFRKIFLQKQVMKKFQRLIQKSYDFASEAEVMSQDLVKEKEGEMKLVGQDDDISQGFILRKDILTTMGLILNVKIQSTFERFQDESFIANEIVTNELKTFHRSLRELLDLNPPDTVLKSVTKLNFNFEGRRFIVALPTQKFRLLESFGFSLLNCCIALVKFESNVHSLVFHFGVHQYFELVALFFPGIKSLITIFILSVHDVLSIDETIHARGMKEIKKALEGMFSAQSTLNNEKQVISIFESL